MTPQSLSIADLKAVIDYVDGLFEPSKKLIYLAQECSDILKDKIWDIIPPTEPKTEEK